MFIKFFKNWLLLIFSLLLVFHKILVRAIVPVNETSLIYYFGPQFTDSKRYELNEATQVLKNPHFKKQETHLYLHGWKESQTSASHNVPVIVDAYLKRKDINLITVDWAKAAGGSYDEVVLENIEVLAPALADVVIDLYNAGLDRKDLRVVGHSVGAQLAGMIGRNVIKHSNGKLKIYRLVYEDISCVLLSPGFGSGLNFNTMAALDAAFPLFVPFILPTINKNDAEFVQMIHIEIGTFGQPISLGHVDFWPNGGRRQPGCSNGFITYPFSSADICGHRRSWRFWAESVANVNGTNPKFLGFPAESYLEFLWAGKNNLKHKPVEMGINCSMSARADYFLKTNDHYPFARGMDGY